VIRKMLPEAVCGMAPMHTHNVNAEEIYIPQDARTLAVSFAGYNSETKADDLVYVAVNSHWEDVRITLPELECPLAWYLSVNTWGDEQNRYFYPEGEEVRIDHEFIMRPRSVAVFTGRSL
ncbi:MAG: glycogen debranching enzyme, partial [Lachnospiraceae bacterium]|nr:glycogen debranching enzyme [Lachnospiraceae bacterium]